MLGLKTETIGLRQISIYLHRSAKSFSSICVYIRAGSRDFDMGNFIVYEGTCRCGARLYLVLVYPFNLKFQVQVRALTTDSFRMPVLA